MSLADQLTVARIALAPLWSCSVRVGLPAPRLLGDGVFCVAMATDRFDGRLARRRGADVVARLAARPGRRQGARARDADRAARRGRLPRLDGRGDRRARAARHRAAAGGARARRRDPGARPRQAEDVGAGDRRGRSAGSPPRARGATPCVVGAARRGRADLGLRARLRPRRRRGSCAAAPSPSAEPGASSAPALDGLVAHAGDPATRVGRVVTASRPRRATSSSAAAIARVAPRTGSASQRPIAQPSRRRASRARGRPTHDA